MQVNLRINTPLTQALGIEGHICELQILYVGFAELKVSISASVCQDYTRMFLLRLFI
jgi:hypothetical protein